LEAIATQVISYVNEKTEDVMFSNLVCASKVVSAASLFRKACRDKGGEGNAWAMDASMKIFIPLFYRFGFVKYAPLTHWQLVRNNYRCTPEMKEVFRRLNCVGGQGLDFKMEEVIQKIIRGARKKDGSALQQAAIDIRDSCGEKEIINEVVGGGAKTKKKRVCRGIERESDYDAFDEVFRLHNTVKRNESRRIITTVDGEFTWKEGVSLMSEFMKGQDDAISNQANKFKNVIPLSVSLLANMDEFGTTSAADDFDHEELEAAKTQYIKEAEIELLSVEPSADDEGLEDASGEFKVGMDDDDSSDDEDDDDDGADEDEITGRRSLII